MAKSGVRGALATIFMAALFAVGSVFASSAGAADGDLDPSFSGDGKQTTDFGDSGDSAKDMAIQSDGKIVAVGSAEFFGEGTDFAVARYLPNGSLDTSFGGGDGKVTTNFRPDRTSSRGANDRAFAVVMQTVENEEKILAVGTSDDGLQDTALARYNADGTLDTSFGNGGKVIIDLKPQGSTEETSLANDVAIDSVGRIVTAGTVNTGTRDSNLSILRFDENGNLDNTFDDDGIVETDFSGSNDSGNGLALTPDDEIIAVGSSREPSDGPSEFPSEFALAKYTSTGDLDPNFGTDGKATTGFGDEGDEALSVALAEGGDLVVAGSVGKFVDCDPNCVSDDYSDFALARYASDGTLITSFGTGGKVTTDFESGSDFAHDVEIQADGKIVAAGRAGDSETCDPSCPPQFDSSDFGLARYGEDGSLDGDFGDGGKVQTSFFEPRQPGNFDGAGSAAGDEAFGLAIQEDGKIIAAGETFEFTRNESSDLEGEYDFAIARYGDAAPTASCAGRPATIVGQPGGGVIVGTPGPDVIVGTSDADDIRGRGGDDVICGRGGDDRILGNSGDDRLYGQRGGDLLLGHGGNDVLNARDGVRGNDLANGGPGNDRCAANPRDQKINCER